MALLRVLLALAFVIAVRAAPNWRISQGVDRCLRDLPELTECVGRARLGTQVLAEMVQCLRASTSTLHQDDIAARELCLKAELADNSTPDAFPLQLQVMYESKCPDSIRFFKEQLTPAFKVLGPERLVVDLIPYGIATTSVSSGTISFTCQHGESECLGNKLQACALVRLDDNAKQVAFVDCVMSSEDPSKPDTKCITDAGLDPTVLNNCATGNEGNVLLAGMGFRTLRGIPLYVPRLTFDGVYSDEDQKAEKNLLAAVCEKLPSNDRPKECPAPSPSQKPSPARTPASIPTATTVVIQFMYETKCRDSKNFVTQQLVDTFAALGSERLQVDFIPYGKSMMSADSGSVSITCHHGPQECVGNKAHACALARLSDNAKQIALVNCAFSSSDPTVLDSKCITDAGLDAADLASCAAGNEGNVLLANMGFRTVPHLPYQPRIILNGEYSEEDLDNAQANLLALVCEKLSPNVRPAACQSSPFVQVQVMYESLCKDSKAFITKQLFPTFTALGPQLMKVDFIPYGKATTSATSWSVSFTCQHGARECMGNKLQACALARLGDNAKQVAFVNCVMSSTDPSKPDDKCITDAGLDISDVLTCAAGYQGHTLLAAMGHRTLPNIPYVPRVTFNGAYTEDDQKNAEANLLPTVCEKLPSAVRPTACPSSTSAAPPTSQPSLPTSSPPPTAKSVQVQIMYEALCPYSIQLINEQVAPALKALGPELMVADLIPYGIAQTYPTAEGYRFTCQHGPNECKGNMLQACGLARIADNKKRIEFVYCVMSSKDPSNPDEECYTNAGLNLIDMDSCSTGTQGQILLADMGFKTLPHIPFVPRISFNGVFNMDDQDNGQSNLILAVCEKLEPSVRPAACKAAPPPPTSGPVPTVPPSGPSSTMTPKPSSSSTFKSSLSAVFLALLTALLGHKQLR